MSGQDLSNLCVLGTTTLRVLLERFDGAVERGLPGGIVIVVDGDGKLEGVVTEGDVRRSILRTGSLDEPAANAMTRNPIVFSEGMSFSEILRRLPEELGSRGRRDRRFLGKLVLVSRSGHPTRILDYHQLWEQRVATHRHVIVLGMGYVGLTLALGLVKEGFRVTGVDTDPNRVAQLKRGESYVHEQGIEEVLKEHVGESLHVSGELPEDGDVYVVTVGTPVVLESSGAQRPNLSAVQQAIARIGTRLKSGDLVVLRSTVPPGTTRDVALPLLEQDSGLIAGRDFHLAFAPERTLEGRALQELKSLPQIIGGLNEDSVEATVALFRELTNSIVRVESLEAAELVKLINNGFRDLSFAFANEMVRLGQNLNVDMVGTILAANRGYPRNKVPLPSPGVGGPCLSKDPYILAAGSPHSKESLPVAGRKVNESMPELVLSQVLEQLTLTRGDPRSAKVLVCGLAFKGFPETGDLRNSVAVEIAQSLQQSVGTVTAHDPVAAAEDIERYGLTPTALPEGFSGVDAVLFLNNHLFYEKLDVFAMTRALNPPGIVYDGWHLFEPADVLSACPAVYLGLGFKRSRET